MKIKNVRYLGQNKLCAQQSRPYISFHQPLLSVSHSKISFKTHSSPWLIGIRNLPAWLGAVPSQGHVLTARFGGKNLAELPAEQLPAKPEHRSTLNRALVTAAALLQGSLENFI